MSELENSSGVSTQKSEVHHAYGYWTFQMDKIVFLAACKIPDVVNHWWTTNLELVTCSKCLSSPPLQKPAGTI